MREIDALVESLDTQVSITVQLWHEENMSDLWG